MSTSLMSTALRLLARGRPVELSELGIDAADLANAPAGNDIEYDDQGRILGWGLSLIPTPHSFMVDGHQLYAWCAADTLIFPAIIGRPAQVKSRCPITDTVISLRVDPENGVTNLAPPSAVISIPSPEALDSHQIRASCCAPGRFFVTPEAAADWLVRHPNGKVLPVAHAYVHLQAINSLLLG